MFARLFSVSVDSVYCEGSLSTVFCSEKVENIPLDEIFTKKMDLETINAEQKDDGALRKKGRPAMQLYVPPARRQRVPKKVEKKNKKITSYDSKFNESTASNSGVSNSEVRLEMQDAPSLSTFNCNDEESEIINGKSEKDCVLNATLSSDEVSRL